MSHKVQTGPRVEVDGATSLDTVLLRAGLIKAPESRRNGTRSLLTD